MRATLSVGKLGARMLSGITRRLIEHLPDGLSRSWRDRLLFRAELGYWPNLAEPLTLAEKLVWLKLHLHHPDYALLSDKLAVRAHVARTAPNLALPDLYWSGTDPYDLNLASLPLPAVLKSNHASGHVLFLTGNENPAEVRATAGRWLRESFGRRTGETFYLRIPRRIFAEQFLGRIDERARVIPPNDYKFLVLNGRVAAIQVFSGRFSDLRRQVYSRTWERLPIWRGRYDPGRFEPLRDADSLPRPERLDAMLGAAEALGRPFPFVRVDLYLVAERVYFGELTFFPSQGRLPVYPRSWDRELGRRLVLPGGAG